MKRTLKFIGKAWLLYAFSMVVAGITIAERDRQERERLIQQAKASRLRTHAILKETGTM